MKEIILGMFTVLIFGGIAHQIFPWWVIVPVAGLVGLILYKSAWSSFVYGFLGAALLWGITAVRLNAGNEGILSARMGETLGGLSGTGILVFTIVLGGILGGLGAMTGTLGRKVFN